MLPPRTMTHHLYEVSWEVCNKVGGIYTVVSSKARTLSKSLGDRYLTVGPMQLEGEGRDQAFEPESGHEDFIAACKRRGVAVQVGRWQTAGEPRTLLVGFGDLYNRKDEILTELWTEYGVDSLEGSWDYVEPVLFGWAAGIAIEQWHLRHAARSGERAVIQAHEWMTGSSLLYLRNALPEVASCFVTHATILGRSLSSSGLAPVAALAGRSPEHAARDCGIPAKHSMESTLARTADVFCTVSGVTADEAELLLGRRPDPVLPNGLDIELIGDLATQTERPETRTRLARLAGAVCGEDISDAAFLISSGRYEYHNKGLDVLLDAAAKLEESPGRRLVMFITVPVGGARLAREVRDRMTGDAPLDGPTGVCSHELPDWGGDPIQLRCAELGLTNEVGSRVKIVQVPAYLPSDGPLDMSYESVLAAMDVSAFPSFYEPWGYTPAESIGVGVPTITTDHAGFGVWARSQALTPKDGITVLDRQGKPDEDVVAALVREIERHLASERSPSALRESCIDAARRLTWEQLIENYDTAFENALDEAARRCSNQAPRHHLLVSQEEPGTAPFPRLMRFDVNSTLPEPLQDLERLAQNLWWSWDPEAPEVFRAISPRMWAKCEENPITFLRQAYPQDLERASQDAAYLARLERVMQRFDRYMQQEAPSLEHDGQRAVTPTHPAAYFCFEFGIHPSLPIYSGGLGILAGDHLKSASDLNIPLVGVGLFYRGGYVRQMLSAGGDQQSLDRDNDPANLPLRPVLGKDGQPARCSLQLPSGTLHLCAWEASIGRVRLILLDSDLPENTPEHRDLTRRLYSGDQEQRLRQEIILGRGGVRMLDAIGLEPSVLHMNEGHAGFAALERISLLVRKEHLTFGEARQVVRAGTAFTTHTPVPAGHDVFSEDLMRRYFADVEGWIGLPWRKFLRLGTDAGGNGGFNMTYLCMHLAAFVNGVAEKHGEVSRALLHPFWSGLLQEEVPVTHITNGIHLPSWVAPEIAEVVGAQQRIVTEEDFHEASKRVAPADLWQARCKLRVDLLEAAAENLKHAYQRRGDDPRLLAEVLEQLHEPNALVVGFARRFASYKRASLLFLDEERLSRLVNDPERPVRFLFSGKAHPRDGIGQAIVKHVAEICRKPEFRGKIVFLEDYDITIARALVQGSDVWLNNPSRPWKPAAPAA